MGNNLCKQLVIKNKGICSVVKSFDDARKLTEGLLYIERCLNPLPVGFIYDSSYKVVLIGDLANNLTWDDYWVAYDQII